MLFILTWYNPFSFWLPGSSVKISLDFLILFFIIQSFVITRFQLIFLGLFLGYLIDLDLETSLVGINSLFLSIAGYFFGLAKINSNNWSNIIKYIYITFICSIIFVNKYIFYQYTFSLIDFISILSNSFLILFTLILIDRFYYKGRLIQ